MAKLLLLSNSTMPGTPFFSWSQSYILRFLAGVQGNGLFIPFAAVTISFDEYSEKVTNAFANLGLKVNSIHTVVDKNKSVEEAAFIVVGGGNSFALLSRMYEYNLVDTIRHRVLSGTPYIGWSAGANLACPTIMTTNDMPVVQPPSLNALNLVPFQINPHYHELKFEGQGGETRRERLEEYMVMNPEKKVVGLPEGMLIHRHEGRFMLEGNGIAKLYIANKPLQELTRGDVSFLL